LAGIGLGLGIFIKEMDGIPYIQFLASGLLITTAMFTAAFEMSFGTYIRLTFDKVYDGMLGAPLTARDLMLGEILWCGTKGGIFSASVMLICLALGALPLGPVLLCPIIGFLAGVLFAVLSLLVSTIVDNINNFNFYFSGFLSPMFFFSGVVFPISNQPPWMRPIAEAIPLTHPVRLVHGLTRGLQLIHLWDLTYIVLFIVLVGGLAIHRISRRLID